jgi:hypothetical protein
MYFLRLGFIVQAKHVPSNTRAAWLGHIEARCDCDCCIGAIAAFA